MLQPTRDGRSGRGGSGPAARARATLLALALALGAPAGAGAQDAAFQAFFFDVCAAPTGALATRCAETPGGGGDLSADSEDSLDPTQALANSQSNLARARALRKRAQERLEERRDERAAEPEGAPGGGSWLESARWSLLGHGHVDWFDRDETGKERGFDGHSAGLQLGADVRLGERGFAGALLSYDRTDSEFDSDDPGLNFVPQANDGSADADAYALTLFGSWDLSERLYVDGSLAYGFTEYDLRRRAVFQEAGRAVPQTNVSAEEETEGHHVTATGGIGFDWSEGPFSIGPYLRASYTWSKVNGYTEDDETGSGLAMRVSDATQHSLATVLGLRSSYALGTSWGVLLPQVRVEYEHEFERDRQGVTTRYVLDGAGTRFRVEGNAPDRDFLNAGVGAAMVLPNGWIPFVDYEGLFGHSFYERHRVTAGLRKEF